MWIVVLYAHILISVSATGLCVFFYFFLFFFLPTQHVVLWRCFQAPVGTSEPCLALIMLYPSTLPVTDTWATFNPLPIEIMSVLVRVLL